MRFIGDYTAKVDAKGRVFLPAQLRKVLEAEGETRCILHTDLFQPCLVLYPESLWNEMLDMMRTRFNPWNGSHQNIRRKFLAKADVVEPDSNGRILINKSKLEHAQITSDVRILAVDDHIEIWDKQKCEDELSKTDTLGDDLQALMADMPISL